MYSGESKNKMIKSYMDAIVRKHIHATEEELQKTLPGRRIAKWTEWQKEIEELLKCLD